MSVMAGAASARSSEEPATIAGRYRIDRLLGRGGAGEVYAVTDLVEGRVLALKRLLSHAGPRAAALFDREYRTLASLRHPGIVEVYDYGTDSLGSFYTMELLVGADLSVAAPMPWRDVCACLRDAASILGVLHARRLLHRDLSPRNLWRTEGGRIKLIDFGALSPFGTSSELAGTPPFVPPEALEGQPLDQRSDLYALGALGYWLLTSVHAYPARALAELPRLFQVEPAAPSSLVVLLRDSDAERVPSAVDDLIAALLHRNPHARPANTSALIDRLCAVAGLSPEADDVSAQAYLHSKAFVGRTRERKCVDDILPRAQAGHGQALLIEATRGMGRTRLLEEVAVSARLQGALTLAVEHDRADAPYGVASGLLLRVLRTLPEEGRKAAESHKGVLAHLAPEVAGALGVGLSQRTPLAHGEARVRLQQALGAFYTELCREHFLAVLVDDLDDVDEESQAFLAALALAAHGQRLIVVATLKRERDTQLSSSVHTFRVAATRFHLLALTAAETHELCESLFGAVPYLSRLSERLFRSAEGVPAHCVALAERLVEAGVITYADGLWSLPTDIALEAINGSAQSRATAMLQDLPPNVRELGATLSIERGLLTMADCVALSGLSQSECAGPLDELVYHGVVMSRGLDYRIVSEDVRNALRAELEPAQKRDAHRRLGEQLARCRPGDTAEQLRTGLHLLHGGAISEGLAFVNRAASVYAQGDLAHLRQCAPLLEEAVQLLSANGVPERAYLYPLATLAVAGYFVERRYAVRYGESAVAALSGALRLERVHTFRFLGKKLALIVTLMIAGVSLRLRGQGGVYLTDAVRLLIAVSSALCGVACICIDPANAVRHARTIEPLAALGEDHVAHFIHAFSVAMATQVQDRAALAGTHMRALIARLESGQPIREMPEYLRQHYLAGLYFPLGVNVSWRGSSETLRIADKLDAFSPMYAMSADYLRASYHAGRGELARAAEFRQRVELHAVQLGTAWQVETWAPADAVTVGMATHDAILVKRAAQQLDRLGEELPSLAIDAQRARGIYLLLRGRHADALALLDADEVPLAKIGWARTRGAMARALNALGAHERALAACEDAIRRLAPEDLAYFAIHLCLQIEAAIANAARGRFDLARRMLSALRESLSVDDNPLMLGSLFEAQAKVELRAGEITAADAHLAEMKQAYGRTEVATLTEHVDVLARALERARSPEPVAAEQALLVEGDVHLLTRVQLMLTQSGDKLVERARKGLQIALELTGADDGFIVVQGVEEDTPAYWGTHAPSQELVRWAGERLRLATARDETAVVEEVDSLIDLDVKRVGDLQYCVAPLWARHGQSDVVVAAIALGFARDVPRLPSAAILGVIAGFLLPAAMGGRGIHGDPSHSE
jgi:tetratricopeptide (TPR) repeat protein